VISFIKDQIDVSTPVDLTVQSISQLIYFLSLAINFFVYYIFGRSYRRTFFGLFTGRKKQIYSQTDYSNLITSRTRKIGHSLQPISKNGHANYSVLNVQVNEAETRIR
jgi:hypothetical protein